MLIFLHPTSGSEGRLIMSRGVEVRGSVDDLAFRAPSTFSGTQQTAGVPGAFQTIGAAERWLNLVIPGREP